MRNETQDMLNRRIISYLYEQHLYLPRYINIIFMLFEHAAYTDFPETADATESNGVNISSHLKKKLSDRPQPQCLKSGV